jgi:hypothetical protein
MVYMIQHQSAAFADGTPGDGMVWIAGDFYDFTVFNVQQDTTSRMAKTAITSANFAKGTPLLQHWGVRFTITSRTRPNCFRFCGKVSKKRS